AMTWSRPTRARGLKLFPRSGERDLQPVAPHAGAWIETLQQAMPPEYLPVAPHAGAWIETYYWPHAGAGGRVAPHAGAWIETQVRGRHAQLCRSRPTRARGLKQLPAEPCVPDRQSRPTRARGLKPSSSATPLGRLMSRPTRARGLKPS